MVIFLRIFFLKEKNGLLIKMKGEKRSFEKKIKNKKKLDTTFSFKKIEKYCIFKTLTKILYHSEYPEYFCKILL